MSGAPRTGFGHPSIPVVCSLGAILHLGQVDGQVVGEPPVPGPERLGLRGLGVSHYFEPVAEWLEVDNPVVPDPELFLLPEKYRCLVVNPRSPVSWWTVSSDSTALLRKAPGR